MAKKDRAQLSPHTTVAELELRASDFFCVGATPADTTAGVPQAASGEHTKSKHTDAQATTTCAQATATWQQLRTRSEKWWQREGLSTLTTDIWKYIPARFLSPEKPYVLPTLPHETKSRSAHAEARAIAPSFFKDYVHIENGQLKEAVLPGALKLLSLEEALDKGLIATERVDLTAKIHNPFYHLNTAYAEEPQVLYLPAGKAQLELFVSVRGKRLMSMPRLIIIAARETDLSIIERYQSSDESNAINLAMSFVLEEGSRITRAKYHELSKNTLLTSTIEAIQAANSTFQSYALIQDASCGWETIGAEIEGSGTTTRCHGLYLLEHQEFYDTHLYVHHGAPETYSQELFKAILFDESRGVFVGRIHVDQGSDNTDAFQSCRALLASNKALMKAQPELEILTDEVRCTHGVAIGQLPPQSLHYCQSRCIPRAEAFKLLLKAFVAEVFLSIPEEIMRDFLHDRVDEYIMRKIKEGAIHV